MISPDTAAAGNCAANEPIDVMRIKLTRPSGTTAVVAELWAADSVLLQWAQSNGLERELNFEVTFVDGYIFRGRFKFAKNKPRRPSLSRLVRHVFSQSPNAHLAWPKGAVFANLPATDLSRYATGPKSMS
jgi:hypothetical protein